MRELLYTIEALERMRTYVASGQPSPRERLEQQRAEVERRFKDKRAKTK